jgi:glycerol kinase
LPNIIYRIRDKTIFQTEGYVTTAGSALKWVRDNLRFFADFEEVEALVSSVPNSGGVFFIPALAGLGAPHWQAATGMFSGLTFETDRARLVCAVLEGVAMRIREICRTMAQGCGAPLNVMCIDGGLSKSNYFCQMVADLIHVVVERPKNTEFSSLGAAELAGLHMGIAVESDFDQLISEKTVFYPRISLAEADSRFNAWSCVLEMSQKTASQL